jgi:hypothetical protein
VDEVELAVKLAGEIMLDPIVYTLRTLANISPLVPAVITNPIRTAYEGEVG